MPDRFPDFEKIVTEYLNSVAALGKILLRAIARANNWAPEWEEIMPGHRSFLRYNFYPKLDKAWTFGEEDNTPLSCVEHFDSGLITLLYQDNVGGLEVQRPSDGKWIPIAPQEDVFVINTGRAMERITNGEAHATKHRVRFQPNTERRSIPYFYQPNPNASIWPFGKPKSEWKFPPVKYLEWYNTNIRKNFPEYAERK